MGIEETLKFELLFFSCPSNYQDAEKLTEAGSTMLCCGHFIYCIPGRKSGLLCICHRYAAAPSRIDFLCALYTPQFSSYLFQIWVKSQFDLSQGHSSNRHFQWKSMDFQLNRHIVLRPLGPAVPFQICWHLRWILQGRHWIRSLHPHLWIFWIKNEFFSL